MYRKKGRGWTKHIDFMLIDIACIVIAFFISYVIRFGFNNPYVDKDYRILGVAFLLIDFFVEIMADSFKNVLKRGYLDEFISTCKHAMLVFLVTALFLFTTQMADIYSRLSFYIMFPIYVTITYVARLALKSFLKKKGFGASRKSLFVIAPDAMLRDTLCTVEKSCIGYTKIVAASLDTDMKGMTICGIPIVANHDGIVDYACDEWVDEVLIPPCSEDEYPERMADIFLEMGIAVHTGITKNGTAQGGYKQIEKIGDYTVVTSSVNYANTSALLVKRGMDIVGGLVGCLFTLIIMIFVGPAIYIASPGPIFFSQERIGRNGRKFKMYKFRSMYMDAEERKKELMAQNKIGDGMMFKMDFDPRIIGNKVLPNGKKKTGIGQFIRKTSLDEFPQFFNILAGDMSLVGTRPPTLDEWEKYEPHHRARMSFRPGLTGLWQVSGRSNITDFEEVVKLDTQYIGEWSVKYCLILINRRKILNFIVLKMDREDHIVHVNLMKKEPLNALAQTQNKRFDMFDVEMAEVTADGFEKVTNAEKSSFVDYFKRMWQVNICAQDYNIKLSEDGFQTLKRRILQILDKCRVESLTISEVHANSFLEVINNLIVEQKQKLQEIQNKEE